MRDEAKRQARRRLRRIEGQVAGLLRMVDEDRYCPDVLTQLSAVRSALDAVGVLLLADHIEGCVVGREGGGGHDCAKAKSPAELIAEIRTTLGRFLR